MGGINNKEEKKKREREKKIGLHQFSPFPPCSSSKLSH
jgi:hypothetical protein